jgi:putative drug exporter of the RND superfamily
VFSRLGPWCHDRRRLVLGLWIAALLVGHVIAGGVGENYRQDFGLPGAESTAGFDILEAEFDGQGAGHVGTIVFRAEQGVDDPEVRSAMQALFDEVAGLEGVSRVESPYGPDGQRLIASQGDETGKIAYANVELPEDVEFAVATDVSHTIRDGAPDIAGLSIERGGFIFADFEEPNAEVFGLAFAIVILIVAFGSVLAMGLPVGVALFGIGIGSALVIVLSNVMQVPDFAPFLGIMIGLGVGIDYALLIVTRHREQLHTGHTVRESIQIAMDTAGRSVVFAGATVVISLLGMLLMGVSFVQGLAVSAAATVAFTVLASVTLLPALLGFAGDRVERTRWRGLLAAGFVAVALVGVGLGVTPLLLGLPLAVVVLVVGSSVPSLRREVAHRPPKPRRETFAYRWSRMVQHRPWTVALTSAAALLILTVPVLSLRLAFSDESNFVEETTTRKAYDLLVDGFGEGFNGPLFLVAETPDGLDFGALSAVGEAVAADPSVVFASPPIPNEAGTAVLWNVVPTDGPQEEATTDLVRRLRDDVLPPVEDATGVDVAVTGIVAAQIDFSNVLAERMPYFFAAVLTLSFLLLMVVFRSLLVPLKAVIMNLLSIGAAYGIVVAIFQWGWLSDLTGVSPGPVEPWAPMMLFAVVFGLSMDYEVFLLSRIREEWHRTGDSRTSVADGLAATAKVITAAAAIMVVVFGSFVLENDRTFKLMGTGLATAIFLDATVVRMLLVPATMELLGDRNWWLPRWLDRLLPNIDVEGQAQPEVSNEDAGGDDGDVEPALVGTP